MHRWFYYGLWCTDHQEHRLISRISAFDPMVDSETLWSILIPSVEKYICVTLIFVFVLILPNILNYQEQRTEGLHSKFSFDKRTEGFQLWLRLSLEHETTEQTDLQLFCLVFSQTNERTEVIRQVPTSWLKHFWDVVCPELATVIFKYLTDLMFYLYIFSLFCAYIRI